ncbi:hypothetical protein BT93_G0681 [Corymbia citriodora subsp. variegata]|nr:hypothetical protein BT93_G0681 [Corymbia citriodora subsp. variegata]
MASVAELKKDDHKSVPVWIHLKNLPYALWSSPDISAVASAIGKPLYVNQRIEQMRIISFARVCGELTANKDRIDSADVNMNGETRTVVVECECRLISCQLCGTFGHKCTSNVSLPAQDVSA